MVDAAKFWDKNAEGYAKSPVRNEEEYLQKLEIMRGYFNPETELFEFACGTGSTALALAPSVKHVLAIDVSSKMLEIAQGKADAAGITNTSFKQQTIEQFNEEGQTFDVAMAHSILHLLRDPEAAIRKVRRMLKPGGIFVTSTVCLGDRFSLWRVAIPIARFLGKAPYVNILSRKQLESYFIDAGFEIDFQWEQTKNRAAFIILKNPA